MTLQIAMMASDGWIIASDKRDFVDPIGPRRFRGIGSLTKMILDQTTGMGLAFWGERWASLVGEALIDSYKADWLSNPDLVKRDFRRIANSVWEREDLSRRSPGQTEPTLSAAWGYRGLIVGLAGASIPFWTIDVGKNSDVMSQQGTEPILAGDVGNPAIFFAYRYFRQNASVEKLKLLAALVVLVARDFNSQGIDGLDLMVCRGRELQVLDADEISNLVAQSRAAEAQIRATLGVPP